ncbi:hypothetical protein GCM10022252_25760 [Streptosporangium oxazolinicum]|uniref:Uncharacterized protein n=1 Tax=Streptosporangium oxazolinicum TaxID=909287 RepID=A0ABP8ASX8_9ACTN
MDRRSGGCAGRAVPARLMDRPMGNGPHGRDGRCFGCRTGMLLYGSPVLLPAPDRYVRHVRGAGSMS